MPRGGRSYFCAVRCAPNGAPTADYLSSFKKRSLYMSAMFLLIGASLLVAVGFLFAFFWAADSGQYEDGYTPSVRVLFDDEKPEQE
jgi:cbb3-type cytochrome oxidase maturation protein